MVIALELLYAANRICTVKKAVVFEMRKFVKKMYLKFYEYMT